MKRILRVFPERTSFTPDDDMAWIGTPDMLTPEFDEVHISCTFTWDRPRCKELYKDFKFRYDKPILLGGPAFGSEVKGFQEGMYLKKGIIFTSRGCNNNCGFCIVPKLEGKLQELPIVKGNIIQDNNFLQCSREHKDKVFEMLKTQKKICFKGGLETRLIDEHFVNRVKSLTYMRGKKEYSRIAELWLACDSDGALKPLRTAVEKLNKVGFNQNKIYCYALIGGKDAGPEKMAKDEARLQEIFKIGAMPRAQLYQHFEDEKIPYSEDWERFGRQWTLPAAIRSHCLKGTSYKDYYLKSYLELIPERRTMKLTDEQITEKLLDTYPSIKGKAITNNYEKQKELAKSMNNNVALLMECAELRKTCQCRQCKWYADNDVCVNGDSDNRAEFMNPHGSCEKCERR